MIVAAVVNLGVSVIMLALFALDWLALWHVISLAFVSSLTWSLDHPTRQALMPDLVGKEDLTNAIALNAVAIEITVVVGPALGGLLIPAFGMTGAYVLIALIYLADLVVLLALQPVKRSVPKVQESPGRSMMEGLKYVRRNRTVLVLLVLAGLLNLLADPYRYAFLPVFARDVLDAGPAGYGMLTAAAGVGALVAGIWVVSLGNVDGKGRMLIWNCFAWSISLVFFSLSTWYYASVLLVFLAGLAQAVCWTFIATLILGHTAQAMRGRVMGIRAGVVVSLPIGNFLGGAVAERFGAPLAQGAYGIASLLVMIAIVAIVPELKRLK
jgi:MFS family permease